LYSDALNSVCLNSKCPYYAFLKAPGFVSESPTGLHFKHFDFLRPHFSMIFKRLND